MPASTQSTLRTYRIHLVPLADDHLEDEVALDADAAVMRYLGNGRPRGREHVVQLHAQRLAQGVDGLGFWAGLVGGEFAGWWLLEPTHNPGTAELGYRLHPRFWRRGLASEGARELLRHGFVDLGLERVIAQTMAVNAGSRATMARVGLGYVRTFHEQWDEPIPGSEDGEVEYAITRDEWVQRTDPRGALRRDLTAALKGRDRVAAAALRSALAAVENAGAADPTGPAAAGDGHVAGSVRGVGAAEVARRVLAADDVRAIVRAEVDERDGAAADLDRLGRPDRAEQLRSEAAVLRRYLA